MWIGDKFCVQDQTEKFEYITACGQNSLLIYFEILRLPQTKWNKHYFFLHAKSYEMSDYGTNNIYNFSTGPHNIIRTYSDYDLELLKV